MDSATRIVSSRTASTTVHFEQTSVSMRVKIALGFLAIYLIWGSTFLATRYAVKTIPPFLVSGSRFFLGGLILNGYILLNMRWRLEAVNQQRSHGCCLAPQFGNGDRFEQRALPSWTDIEENI